jgi:hypothetical protein
VVGERICLGGAFTNIQGRWRGTHMSEVWGVRYYTGNFLSWEFICFSTLVILTPFGIPDKYVRLRGLSSLYRHIGVCMVLDPSTYPPPLSWDKYSTLSQMYLSVSDSTKGTTVRSYSSDCSDSVPRLTSSSSGLRSTNSGRHVWHESRHFSVMLYGKEKI